MLVEGTSTSFVVQEPNFITLQIGVSQKELNTTTSKYGKILDKSFNPDIAKSYRDVEFDSHLINQIIVQHFYRLGLFELGDCFAKESQESNAAAALKTHLYEMYQNLDQLQAKNLEPALNWARKNRQSLEAKVRNNVMFYRASVEAYCLIPTLQDDYAISHSRMLLRGCYMDSQWRLFSFRALVTSSSFRSSHSVNMYV